MTTALIGHTGFVGSTLLVNHAYDLCIHRANLDTLKGQRLQRVVCAALPAAKWLANRDPQADLANMQRLCEVLASVQAAQFVLISTVDVYPCPREVDEDSPFDAEANHAYGAHRGRFERFVREHFADALILRLPALFGPGLKKNIIFDLEHDNALATIQPRSLFQWYPLTRLADDIARCEAAGLRLVNMCSVPLSTADILTMYFPTKVVGENASAPVVYDVRSKHADVWAGEGGYMLSKGQVLAALGTYLQGPS